MCLTILEKMPVPRLSIFPRKGIFQKIMQLHLLHSTEHPPGFTFIDLFVPDEILPECPDTYGKQVTGERFSPLCFAFFIRSLKAAPRNIALVEDEHAIALFYTGRCETSGGAFNHAQRFNGVDASLRKILPGDGVGLLKFEHLVVFQRGSSAARQGAACTLALAQIAAEWRCSNNVINDCFADDEHPGPYASR